MAGFCEHYNGLPGSIYGGSFLSSRETVSFSRRAMHHDVGLFLVLVTISSSQSFSDAINGHFYIEIAVN